ncbi:MAG: hypothetical protein V7606_2815 [Burkholderiales bacterium]
MNEQNWPYGGGATGALVRTLDWSRTSLGPKSQWPQSLRTTVDIVMNSPAAMVLMWGADHVMVYNDAYSIIAGAKHPHALGGTVPGIWPEIWDWNRVILEAGFRGEVLTYPDQHMVLERNGAPEDVWFDLFYTPVRGERSEVQGVLCTVIDATQRVQAQRRQAEAEEDLRRVNHTLEKERDAIKDANRRLADETGFLRGLFEQAPSFMAVLSGPDHVFELANAPYMKLVGRGDIVGKPMREALPEVEEQGFNQLLHDVYSSGKPYVGKAMKVVLQTRADGPMEERMVDFVYQPLRAADGTVSGIFVVGSDMTERLEAEERLRIAQDAGGIGTFEWFPDTGKLVYSDAYRRLWGFPPGTELNADLLVSLVDPADRLLVGPARMDGSHNPLEYVEYRITRPDTGEKRWLARRGEVVQGDARARRRYVGAAFDITERKRSEEALREAEKRMGAIFGQASVGLSEIDMAGRFVRANDAMCNMLGRSREEMLTLDYPSITHPDDLPECRSLVRRAVELGQPFSIEKRYLRADGTYVWANSNVTRIVDELGQPQSIIAVITDISQRRQAEETLRLLNETLEWRVAERTAERDRIWRMSQDIMAVASFNGYFVGVNPAFTAVLGWSEQEATAIPLMDLTHPQDRSDLMQKLALLAQGQPLVRYEVRDLHKDGSFRWISWTIVPEGGFLYGVARDVTEEKKQAEALRHTEDALRQAQKMEAVGQLTGGIAHDFNNLLAAMMGNLEMTQIRVDQGRSVDVARHIEAAKAVTSRAAALTHRLLAFSRRQTLDPKPTNVNRLVASMGELIQSTVGPAIELEVRLLDGLWGTLCDPHQLESGLLNLAINARDAMPNGGRLIIETSNLRADEAYVAEHPDVTAGDYMAISVIDTGIGMTPEVAARAFDPFFTTKPIGQGTGLGLSMVYGFVKQSRGNIRIYSEPGKGTTVRLKLPRVEGMENAATAPQEALAAPTAPARVTVLVVDDEPDLRSLVTEMLEMLGYATIDAGDGPEALRVLESSARIDLLLTDVGMPGGMDGRQLAEAARVLRPDLKVLFVTGYAEAAAVRDGLMTPGMQVMTKPFTMDVLAGKVAAMIDAVPAMVAVK